MTDTFARAKPVPRRAVLRALTVLMIVVVSLAPGLAQDRAAAAVIVPRGNLNFVNQTNTTLWIAIYYLDEDCGKDGWVSTGWWSVAPAGVTAVLRLPEGHHTNFYYYAFGEDGTTFFTGSTTAYFDRNHVYAWCILPGRSYPGVATVQMKEIVIPWQTTTYTVPLGTDYDVPIEYESSPPVPIEPANQSVPDERGCTISGGVSTCPAPD